MAPSQTLGLDSEPHSSCKQSNCELLYVVTGNCWSTVFKFCLYATAVPSEWYWKNQLKLSNWTGSPKSWHVRWITVRPSKPRTRTSVPSSDYRPCWIFLLSYFSASRILPKWTSFFTPVCKTTGPSLPRIQRMATWAASIMNQDATSKPAAMWRGNLFVGSLADQSASPVAFKLVSEYRHRNCVLEWEASPWMGSALTHAKICHP